jgi:hypothetical protein
MSCFINRESYDGKSVCKNGSKNNRNKTRLPGATCSKTWRMLATSAAVRRRSMQNNTNNRKFNEGAGQMKKLILVIGLISSCSDAHAGANTELFTASGILQSCVMQESIPAVFNGYSDQTTLEYVSVSCVAEIKNLLDACQYVQGSTDALCIDMASKILRTSIEH